MVKIVEGCRWKEHWLSRQNMFILGIDCYSRHWSWYLHHHIAILHQGLRCRNLWHQLYCQSSYQLSWYQLHLLFHLLLYCLRQHLLWYCWMLNLLLYYLKQHLLLHSQQLHQLLYWLWLHQLLYQQQLHFQLQYLQNYQWLNWLCLRVSQCSYHQSAESWSHKECRLSLNNLSNYYCTQCNYSMTHSPFQYQYSNNLPLSCKQNYNHQDCLCFHHHILRLESQHYCHIIKRKYCW